MPASATRRHALATAMAKRMPPHSGGCLGGDAPRMFTRALIRYVADHGTLPNREDFTAACMATPQNWVRWTRWAANAGMITRHYGYIELSAEVVADAAAVRL